LVHNDPILRSKPDGISNDDLSLNATRRIFSEELYPLTDIAQGQSQVVNTLDLTYYPSERTITVQTLQLPRENYGGIMRSLNSTNFEQGNVEYIQLWILDPFVGNGKTAPDNVGKIYF
jgi:cell surface protein SprA